MEILRIVLIAAAWLVATPVIAVIMAVLSRQLTKVVAMAALKVFKPEKAINWKAYLLVVQASRSVGEWTVVIALLAGWVGLLIWFFKQVWG